MDSQYGLPPDYVSRAAPEPFPDVDDGLSWQQAVYDAALAAYRGGLVVDIGCGRARKLCVWVPEVTLGIDVPATVDWLRAYWPDRRWEAADLEAEPMTFPLATRLVICADVIEHLVNPLPLMQTLQNSLMDGATVFLSTPDRVAEHGKAHRGPPPNVAHVREWTLTEFQAFCQPWLGAGEYSLVPPHNHTTAAKTIMAIFRP